MKILGVFSFIFGSGLLAIAAYGIHEEKNDFTDFVTIVIIFLILSGSSTILFVVNTFNRKRILSRSRTSDTILDIPDHIIEEEKSQSVSPFIIGCGIFSMIVGSLGLLFSIFASYDYLLVRIMMSMSIFTMEFLLFSGIFISSILLLIYCIRKLFFSRK